VAIPFTKPKRVRPEENAYEQHAEEPWNTHAAETPVSGQAQDDEFGNVSGHGVILFSSVEEAKNSACDPPHSDPVERLIALTRETWVYELKPTGSV
jgi:hypothetical protein